MRKCKLKKVDRPFCSVSYNKGGIMMVCRHCKHQYVVNNKKKR